jgi:hypothetical protein
MSDSKLEMVRALIGQAPDSAIRSLLLALSADQGHDGGLSRVHALIEAEASDRRARNMAFSPIAPLCVEPGPFTGLCFPPRTLSLAWKALKQEAPDEVKAVKALAADWRSDSSPELFDLLCAHAAERVHLGGGAFGAVAEAADAGAGRQALAACLDIAPVTRRALDQMPEWLGRMTGEKAAKLRLAYRDAVAVADDAGPRFFEMLAAHLTEPWLILRVISGVMDRPSEAYVSGSELAGFSERVLADIDRRLVEVTAFKSTSGREAAQRVAAAVHLITIEIAEIEQSIHLTPEGTWGRRVAAQKHALATTIEGHLKATSEAINAALPVQTRRLGPRAAKGLPRLTTDPDPVLADKAATLLMFMNEVRVSAPDGGFASARAKAQEAVELRLDTYVEHLLEEIRAEDTDDHARARAYLELAAEFCGLIRDEKSAQIVRRRAAAA